MTQPAMAALLRLKRRMASSVRLRPATSLGEAPEKQKYQSLRTLGSSRP